MTLKNLIAASAILIAATSVSAFAQNVDRNYEATISAAELNPQLPVTDADIRDRPYRVIGTVQTSVRKATIFSSAASQRKIFKELWERASRMGADAVVQATAGESHITAFSWGSTHATGKAIQWVEEVNPAPRPRYKPAAPLPVPAEGPEHLQAPAARQEPVPTRGGLVPVDVKPAY